MVKKIYLNLPIIGLLATGWLATTADAQTVLDIVTVNNPDMQRMITMGHIDNRLHVIVYTEREDVIRIISARKANKREQERYGNG